jgi:hypothetical protein
MAKEYGIDIDNNLILNNKKSNDRYNSLKKINIMEEYKNRSRHVIG